MSVNKDLLEKYHSSTCSPEERKQVEEWLFSAEVEELDESIPFDKSALKAGMWMDIKTVMPEAVIPKEVKPLKTRSNTYFIWKGAIAASLIIICLATAYHFLFASRPEKEPMMLSFINSSGTHTRHVDQVNYTAYFGPNTVAEINSAEGAIDLTGSILITPKKDIALSMGTDNNVTLRKGQTYIILKNNEGEGGIIVVNQHNLMDLPPVIQKQINTQFGI